MVQDMLNGSDVLVLVHLAAARQPWTYRSLAEKLDMDVASVHRSVGRLKAVRLLDEDRHVKRSNLEEFLVHALQFVLPAELGPIGRGVPTAWGAEPLRSMLAESSEPLPVWSDPNGASRGPVIQPISERALMFAKLHPEIAEWLALLDALRVGRARDKKVAADEIRSRIWASADVPA